MKALIFILVIILVTGCKYKKQSEQLLLDKNELSAQMTECDSTLRTYSESFQNMVATIGEMLPENQDLAQPGKGEDFREDADRAVKVLVDAYRESESNYRVMRNRYANASSRVSEIEGELADLRLMVEEKDSIINVSKTEISGLNDSLEEVNMKVDDLVAGNAELSERIGMMTGQMNTAYYAIGTEDELISGNIIEKTGGFLGFLGRVNTFSPSLDREALEKIDIREHKTFTLKTNPRKIEIITLHPSSSYKMEVVNSEEVVVTVTDPEKFWSLSNYLVIVI